jgi:hypothetical protein
MKYMALAVVAVFLVTSCAGTTGRRTWTFGEKALGTVAITGCLADYYTTQKGLDAGGYAEANPFLGEHPDHARLGLWTVGVLAGGLLAAHFFPEHRPYILALWAALESYGAVKNYKLLHDNGDW